MVVTEVVAGEAVVALATAVDAVDAEEEEEDSATVVVAAAVVVEVVVLPVDVVLLAEEVAVELAVRVVVRRSLSNPTGT